MGIQGEGNIMGHQERGTAAPRGAAQAGEGGRWA